MADRNKSIINNSPSKQQFAFSKSERFGSTKAYTNAFSYEIKGQFGHAKGTNAGKGFNSSQGRMKPQKDNSSPKIDGPGGIDRTGKSFAQTHQFSFGVSRDTMKKLYVDEILKKGIDHKEPGPSNYEHKSGFGKDAGNHGAARYSMRPKIDPFQQHLDKQKKLPGPGNYAAMEHLTGRPPCVSVMSQATSNAFSKAKDRFRVSGGSHATPAPAHYAPKNNLNQNASSTFKYVGHTRIGSDKRTFMDINWNPKEQQKLPGPNSYHHFSDFGGMSK